MDAIIFMLRSKGLMISLSFTMCSLTTVTKPFVQVDFLLCKCQLEGQEKQWIRGQFDSVPRKTQWLNERAGLISGSPRGDIGNGSIEVWLFKLGTLTRWWDTEQMVLFNILVLSPRCSGIEEWVGEESNFKTLSLHLAICWTVRLKHLALNSKHLEQW